MKKTIVILILSVIGMSCMAGNTPEPDIIPQPQSIVMAKSTLNVKGINFNYDSALETRTVEAIGSLADQLYICTGKPSSIASATGVNAATDIKSLKGAFFLKDASIAPEAYVIEVSKKP